MPADEFEIIRTLFAPLAQHRFARGLIDDVAVIESPGQIVVTADAIVAGVHFLAEDPLDTVAKKALRVNVSDLVAKGALPVGFVIALMWPQVRDAAGIAAFAQGLAEDLRFYDAALLGGDTTSTPGPLSIAVTAFGIPHGARTPARADARAGDQVWVTGYIGDAFLGLRSLTQTPDVIGADAGAAVHADAVRAAYRTPAPPHAFAPHVAAHARASMDVSDGLVADAAKMAAASKVGIRLDAEAIPLSAAGHAFCAAGGAEALIALITAGDDYQALFTADPSARSAIMAAARETETNVALIGDVVEGAGVRVTRAGGAVLPISAGGHSHKLGR
ncbi:MAG: thiamine-phosphate kinase [Hyphomonadaceae bacterium]